MASVRIRGLWRISLTAHEGAKLKVTTAIDEAELEVFTATRSSLSGEFRVGNKKVPVKGRVKPGSPAVVTISEATASGGPVADGLEAIVYIPPWWPTVDYEHDLVFGTMVIGKGSSIRDKELRSRLIAIMGVQPFA
ncbi:hypothetical protein [Bradyrhizobium sp. CCH5-F6]|jgi:hypothetical protein|uniref:hypothetical protein n=1 Tax=Bradyrhizobium sp. CCH5-F6 TaxID=1768753 RepID=UPI0012E35B4D|nr:hypothetical protein [Bradyrhizobium sp. CCH5-F6]